MTNVNRLPVILSMTCLDGYWNWPRSPFNFGLIESLLRAGNGGIVASFSPTGLGLTDGHDVLNRQFFTSVFTDGVQRLGPAALAAKVALYNTGGNLDLVETYAVFGDPALNLPTYRLGLAPSTATGEGPPTTMVVYSMQITNSGLLTDTVNMSATGNVWPVSFSPPVVKLDPGASAQVNALVTVPAYTLAESTDVVTVTAQSHGDSTRATVRLTTIVRYQAFLPLLMKQ